MTFNPQAPEPGVYADLPIEVYHSSPGWSRSTLKGFIPPGVPADAKFDLENPRPANAGMHEGQALEVAVFEPDRWGELVAVRPVFKLPTQDGKPSTRSAASRDAAEAWERENAGRIIIDEAIAPDILRARDLVHARSSKIRRLLERGTAQRSFYWNENGALVKARPDFDGAGMTLDLKKTRRNLDNRELDRDIADFYYDVQGAMCLQGKGVLEGPGPNGQLYHWILWVRLGHPRYPVAVRATCMDSDWIQHGYHRFQQGLAVRQECERTGHYPGWSDVDPRTPQGQHPAPKWVSIENAKNEDLDVA